MARPTRIIDLFNTLTGRIIFGGILIHAILIPLFFAGIALVVKEAFQNNFIDDIRNDTFVFASALAQESDTEVIQTRINDGLISGSFVMAEVVDYGTDADASTTPSGTFVEDFYFGQHNDNIYFISMPLPTDQHPGRMLHLGFDEEPVTTQIRNTYYLFVYLTIGYIVLILLFSAVSSPLLTRPLHRLQLGARRIAMGNYDTSLGLHSRIEEIKSLADNLETMRARLVEHNKELEHRSLHDHLTDLPNRSLFRDRLRQTLHAAKRSGTMFAILMVDLDGFKHINDTLGHHAGDTLLQQVAMRLRVALRSTDTVGRLGGDEFAILVPELNSLQDLNQIINKLSQDGGAPLFIENKTCNIGMSIGIALYPEHGQDENTLMRHADIAMYVCKRNHLNHTFYDEGQERRNLGEITLIWDLRKAMEQRQLRLMFQPIVSLRNRRIARIEAVLRWHHPERGILLPESFLHLAAQTGLSETLIMWILKESRAQQLAWERAGISLPVSVNVMQHDLHNEQVIRTIEHMIAHDGMRPSMLMLEIAETEFPMVKGEGLRNLERLRASGIGVTIDNFGTGNTALTSIHALPVDEIKIDRSIILNLASEPDGLAPLVRAIVNLSHSMDQCVTAVGVQEDALLEIVEDLDCDYAQGLKFSKPLSSASLLEWLRSSGLAIEPPKHEDTGRHNTKDRAVE